MALSVDQALSKARAKAGLDDWGPDGRFRVGLEALIASAAADGLSETALQGLEGQIVDLLVTRLRFVEDETRYPEILAQPIERPLILTGLPRTGTTILHDLCALDPKGRAPQEWEAAKPWPAPELATYATDPRIAETQAGIDAMLEARPVLRTIHPWGATLPADCLPFFALSFVTTRFVAGFGLPAYSHWLSTHKAAGVYQTHKRALQQLQWRGPKGRWVLKEPQHLLDMDQLLSVYPDAMIVQTHRDPVRTLPSVASFIWAVQSLLQPDYDKKITGRQVMEMFDAHLRNATTARRSPAVDERVLDIAYRDTVLDPVGTVRRIHAHFGLDFSDEHARRIEHHMAANPQGKHGAHHYTAEEYGLDEAALAGFAPEYREQFGHLLSEPSR